MGTLQYYVGCTGWSYTSWQGPFYPQNLTNSGWLNYYSHVFDYVEIDSSFWSLIKQNIGPFDTTSALLAYSRRSRASQRISSKSRQQI